MSEQPYSPQNDPWIWRTLVVGLVIVVTLDVVRWF